MCNPRRITITATRTLAEAWQREVTQTVNLTTTISGSARIKQPLTQNLSQLILRALEQQLVTGKTDWLPVTTGYCHHVTGGYVIYHLDEQALEIVAELTDNITTQAIATGIATGEIQETLTAEAEGIYHDEGWAGQTREKAQREAEKSAQQRVKALAQTRLTAAQTASQNHLIPELQAQARHQAEKQLASLVETRTAQLNQQAIEQLTLVGTRCRHAFHQLLATAYREVILAYARRHGAENLQCTEENGVIDIEFFIEK